MAEAENTAGANVYESPSDTKDSAGYVARWLSAIDLAGQEEEEWRKSAETAMNVYAGDADAENIGTAYNLYHSNIETLVPALYNSTPIPDVRRRYGDKDEAAKAGADVIERSLSYLVDEYDFDGLMNSAVLHYSITGRGVVRVHYDGVETDTGMTDGAGNPVQDIGAERVWCSLVPWADFRRGPARSWETVPWVAFRHHLTRDELKAINPDIGATVALDASVLENKDEQGKDEADIYKRGCVWEIWEKASGKVIFIAPAHKSAPLSEAPDPLGLMDFYPTPRPMMKLRGDDTLVPLCSYEIQKPLLNELDTLSVRIRKLVKQLRPRALGPVNIDIDRLASADDGEIVGVADVMGFLDSGGMDKLLSWFPLEPTVRAIEALYIQREQTRQQLFEVSGIADIMRGQTDSGETLGAQQIKTQWGSLRVQKAQQDVQRFARDIMRLKAELVAEKFNPVNIAAMTGLKMDDQSIVMLKDDKARSYRIDIETDSTVRGDLTRNMTAMSQFVGGSAQFFQAFGAAVEAGFPMDAIVAIYSAFARNFKLGKEVDSILDGLPDRIRQQREQAQQQPNPEQVKAEAEAEKVKMDLEATKAKTQMEMEKGKADLAMKGQAGQMDLQIKQAELGLKGMEMQMKREEMGMKAQASQIDHAMKIEQGQQSHALAMKQMQDQARMKAAANPR